jgi:hypothetical protein
VTARCEADPDAFERTDKASHKYAQQFCHGIDGEGRCPLFDACQARADDFRKTIWRAGLTGTWAGVLYKDGKVVTKKHQGKPREHGTERGYYQHRNRKENACVECLEAMRFATWLRRKYGTKV